MCKELKNMTLKQEYNSYFGGHNIFKEELKKPTLGKLSLK